MKRLSQVIRETASRGQQRVRQALRGVLSRLDATAVLPPAQVAGLAGEKIDAELIQHYGFASAPLQGAEVVLLPIGGDSGHCVVIASIDGRYRIELQPGEVAIHTDEGDYIHLKRGRLIEVVTQTLVVKASTKVRFETPLFETTEDAHVGGNHDVDGDAHADGDVSDGKRSMQADRDIYNSHKHGETGAVTGTPQQQQ